MEIRQVLRGTDTSFAAARPARKAESGKTGTAQPAAERLELSRQWVDQMQEQSARIQALLSRPGEENEDGGGLLGYMETEEDELDALSEELDVQMKCLKIAMNIMKGKKVPPEDERYLMEHDPEGYKITIALRKPPKRNEKECESVLKDGEESSGETGETAPEAGGEASSGGEE